MRTPDNPESIAKSVPGSLPAVRSRLFAITASACCAIFSSIHGLEQRQSHQNVPRGTFVSSPVPSELQGATKEQCTELDHAAGVCLGEIKRNPWIFGQLSYFFLWNPHPQTKEIKQLADSMPGAMQPELRKIAHLVALNPKEAFRLKALITEKTGFEFSRCQTAEQEESCFRATAIRYLKLSDTPRAEAVEKTLSLRLEKEMEKSQGLLPAEAETLHDQK